MSEPLAIAPELYWQIRTRMLEHQRTVAQAQAAVDTSQARLSMLLTAAGLDPSKTYRLTDETLTATVASAQ